MCVYIYIYISNAMEFGLRPLGFMEFLQNNNHEAVNKMKFHGIKYTYLIFIYLLLYNSSILDIKHSPYYIVLGLLQTHKVI